jgi:hypothetical protein
VQPASSAGYAYKSDIRAVPKIVGEFLRPYGRQGQVNCCWPPDWGVFLLEGKDGLAHSANLIQKNVSFKSKHEKQVASAGIRANKLYKFGTSGCKVTAA